MNRFVLFSCVAFSLAMTRINAEEMISSDAQNLMTKHSSHSDHHHHHHQKGGGKGSLSGSSISAVFSASYTIGSDLGQHITSTPTPLLFETPTTGTPAINYPVIHSPISYTNSGPTAGSFTLSTPGIYLITFSGLVKYQQGVAAQTFDNLSISLVNTTTSQSVNPSPIIEFTFANQDGAYDWPIAPFSGSNCVQIITPQSYQIQGTFTPFSDGVAGIDNTLLNIILLVPF